jgi:hypothetical protein
MTTVTAPSRVAVLPPTETQVFTATAEGRQSPSTPAPLMWTRPDGKTTPASPAIAADDLPAPPPHIRPGAPPPPAVAPVAPPPRAEPDTRLAAQGAMPAPSTPRPVQPGPVRPAEARSRPAPAPEAPAPPPLQPGDLVCGECGAGNDPARCFCRRCGHALSAAARAVSAPWYRRLLRRHPEDRWDDEEDATSSKRPSVRERLGAAMTWMQTTGLAVVLLVVVALSFLPSVRGPIVAQAGRLERWGKQLIAPTYTQVIPDGMTQSAGTPLDGHAADRATDGDRTSDWASSTSVEAHPTLTIQFDQPIDLDALTLIAGAPGADFQRLGRPAVIHATFSDGSQSDLSFDSTTEEQTRYFSARHVTWVQLRVDRIAGPQTTVAITEIGFFTES